MSENIKHECGIAYLRLLKPPDYYLKKYGTLNYGLNKMFLLMQKQRNRGQDGAGLVSVKTDVAPGLKYISRERSNSSKPIEDIFSSIYSTMNKQKKIKKNNSLSWRKNNVDFTGDIFLGHLRYGTFGKNSIDECHPFVRQNNWKTRNLVLAGNFNLTNSEDLFRQLINLGQHPKKRGDTITLLEKIGHFLDEENDRIYYKHKSSKTKKQITKIISDNLELERVLKKSLKHLDGGYVLSGVVGHGDSFIVRDPAGIRPVYFYQDEEVVVVASERPVIQTTFNLKSKEVQELQRGQAILIKKNGKVSFKKILKPQIQKSCSFERIYFSRGNDSEIYKERTMLGKNLALDVLEDVNYDVKNTVFSFIPNTAEVAFYGLVKGVQQEIDKIKLSKLKDKKLTENQIKDLIFSYPRVEKIAIKDAKLRTFITSDNDRQDLVGHVYDITYGVIRKKDTLVMLDDSIVRGTTLKHSILRILDRLDPKKIIIVSSAPQIRYPDCYGIDMAKMGEFVAFQAAISLLKEQGKQDLIKEVYELCKKDKSENHVKKIYSSFTSKEISNKIAEIIMPENMKSKLKIIYQTIKNLHKSCPNHKGDWYFTGNYPTVGGNRVVNNSFVNYIEGKKKRAY
ncbi:MAG: amidophosphoribosyltransferase [Flavobacteriales bacterium]|nr:amidophosphoribosyltransferase [Flavobacteriales bacterium]|tara:strand:- start:1140 stop:3005 length:1866 start_codon:yes stop_codon:yes gene_type:complete